jgi:hypothetical protein
VVVELKVEVDAVPPLEWIYPDTFGLKRLHEIDSHWFSVALTVGLEFTVEGDVEVV